MATTIDSSWLSSNGPAPYVLDTDDEVYTLSADVRVTSPSTFNGPVFLLTGVNVYLNLNGFRCYINGWPVPQQTSSLKASENEARGKSTDPIKNVGLGLFTLGGAAVDMNLDPTNQVGIDNA
jgi:hypothetical protein